jgi:hypothetical protein
MSKALTRDWMNLFMKEFGKESDRACVILSAAMMDTALEIALKTYFLPTGSSHDSLLEGQDAPLSSFGARIDIAYRLGLISTKFHRDLHIIRKIRNDFAHDISGCSFENMSVRNRINELIRSSGIVRRCPKRRKGYGDEGPKGDFQMTISWMLWHLCNLPEKLQTIAPSAEEFGYTFKDAD